MTHYPDAITARYLLMVGGAAAEKFGISFDLADPARAMKVRVVRIRLPTSSGAPLWFFGTGGRSNRPQEHQFVGIYNSDALALANLLAGAYHYDERVATLGLGHTVPFEETSPLRKSGYSHFVTLAGSTYAPLPPEKLEVQGVPTTLFAVIPITPAELELKTSAGLGRLIDSWKQSGRSLTAVGKIAGS